MSRTPARRTKSGLRVEVGPEKIILTDGLQPFMFRTKRGTLVAQAQLSFPPNHVHLEHDWYPGLPGTVVSRDVGKTWKRWLPPLDLRTGPHYDLPPEKLPDWSRTSARGPGPVFEGAATQLRDGTILVLNYATDGPSSTGTWWAKLWESADDFQTVRGPTYVTIHMPQARCGIGDAGEVYCPRLHRTLLELPSGDLLATTYGLFQGDAAPAGYGKDIAKMRSMLLRSSDRGRAWKYVSTIAVDPTVGEEGFDEPVVVRVSKGPRKGRLVALMRTGSNACSIHQTHSDDEGATWAPPRALPFRGVDPDLIEMADGTLACSFGWRTRDWLDPEPSPEHGNYVVFSLDVGETWTGLTRFPFEPNGVAYSTCYTGLREIRPGVLLVLYDIGCWGHAVRYVAGREVRVARR